MSLLNVPTSPFMEISVFCHPFPPLQRGEETSDMTDHFHRMERKILEKTFPIN